ncbi:hypothetical protein TPHA_0P01370 [Tetrapisispora phaffii CBS 4417]|uniref:Small ribosomal subunit protein uS11m n=1 Tax=Tetrapisispora phaffii (strain ATCC 24235 / CBS 4417 / NBRC 1672 / NRRL Y-8282 / UCD 70-5) TaxID=1071381 RepID=G8C2B7_TETPH|nr:mitochondrial 37S ribosomal protein YmS18 TPHA_0P01370 [Tetrapisispora phaffii CBS 4417]CCE66295.1 hypothetical protein TPHA_0P01370 [Tetrapisispora phaffii CBS 4417]
MLSGKILNLPLLGKVSRFNNATVRMFSGGQVAFNEKQLFAGISDMLSSSRDITNISTPIEESNGTQVVSGSGKKKIVKPNERTVKYVLSCLFGKNNTHFTYSAVVEDTNYMKLNSDKSYNEQFLYYYNLPRKVKFSISTGCLGFRKAARGEYEAAFQTSAKVFQMIQEKRLMDKDIEIVMKDFGKGRAAFTAALNGKEGNNIRKNNF